MKNLALQVDNSKSESENESDEDLSLILRNIKRMFEKRNKMMRENMNFTKDKSFSKDSKYHTCFEYEKVGHFKDCYKLKSKQVVPSRYKKKKNFNDIELWIDDENSESFAREESNEDMVYLAFVGTDNESFRGKIEDVLVKSDLKIILVS